MKKMKFKKNVSRCKEELKATREIANVTSWRGAISTFYAKMDIQIMNHNGFQETPAIRRRLEKKHEVLLEYFEKTFATFMAQYVYNYNISDNYTNYESCIWMCWWQGLDKAPDVVKKCVESIKKNTKEHKVIVITEDNYKNYVEFPTWIEQKREKGIISKTHYSDLLRLELLARYGGIWLDSTFFCAKAEVDNYFKLPVWSIKRPDYGHISVACGEFANYSFGCDYEHRWVFAVIRDFVLQYWKTHDIMIDYLFLDYLIVLLQRHNDDVADIFSNIPCNNPFCDELFKIMNKKYDDLTWENLKKETVLFKLTWKQKFKKKEKNEDTFYSKFLEGYL